MKIAMCVFCIVFMFSMGWAKTYKWVDEKGTVHFTEELSEVPEKFRDQAEIKGDKAEDLGKEPEEKNKGDLKKPSKGKVKAESKKSKSKDEKQSVNRRKIESDVTDAFTEIVSFWKDGRYESLYECGTLSSRGSVTKEDFVSRMGKKSWGLTSSWETLRDIKVEIKDSKSAYATAKMGYKPKRGGNTSVRTETYQLKLESGAWRVDLSKILKAAK